METTARYLLKTGFPLDDPKYVRRYLEIDFPTNGRPVLSDSDFSKILARILGDVYQTVALYEWLVRRYDPNLMQPSDDFKKVEFSTSEFQR